MKTPSCLDLIQKSAVALAWICGVALLGLSPTGSALAEPAIYTSGHGDIDVDYHNGDLELHWHMGVGAVVNGVSGTTSATYEPADLIARTTATRLTPSGGGGLSGLLGVPDGTRVFVMGSPLYQPNLGWGTDHLTSGWIGDTITVTFNPGLSTIPSGGAFAMYTTNVPGTIVNDKLFSSVSAAATDFGNTVPLATGGHVHFQLAFTEEGFYGLNFTFSGTHVTDGPKTASATFGVQAVPEPSTIAMLTMAGGAAAIAGIRRHRRAASMRSA